MMAQENVFLFVPNLIGYARIVLAIVSFLVMIDRPYLTASLYFLSGLLDAFDGYAARKLNQGTKLGAALDMLTDRCATTCLLVGLSLFYPKNVFVIQMLITLDIVSHWLQMYSSLLTGSSSHKNTDESAHYLLRIYYTSRLVLFVMCGMNEMFFGTVYLLHFGEGPTVIPGLDMGLWRLGAYVSFPFMFLKQVISVIQLIGAARIIASVDLEDRHPK